MSKNHINKKKKKKPRPVSRAFNTTGDDSGGWTPMYANQFHHPAFKALSSNAKVLYLQFRHEIKDNTDLNAHNQDIILTREQMRAALRIGKTAVGWALNELIEFKFIRVMDAGGNRKPAVYRLSVEWNQVTAEQAETIRQQLIDSRREHRQRTEKSKQWKDAETDF